MDLLKLLHVFLALCQQNKAEVWPKFLTVLNWTVGFVEVVTLISFSCFMASSKLIHVFLQSCHIDVSKLLYIFSLCQTTQAKAWPKVQSPLRLLLRPKGVDWVKVFNTSCPLCLWQFFWCSWWWCLWVSMLKVMNGVWEEEVGQRLDNPGTDCLVLLEMVGVRHNSQLT